MHITRFTDYSLRVLIYVALNRDNLCTIQEIADSYNISKNHLMKVVQELNAQGYLNAIRGKNGGLRLGMEANEINIGELVRTMEQDLSLVECFSDGEACAITKSCKLKGIFGEALKAFLSVLDQYTLADVITPRTRKPLLKILQIA